MERERVVIAGYARRAAESLKQRAKALSRAGMREDANVMNEIVSVLSAANTIVLPSDGMYLATPGDHPHKPENMTFEIDEPVVCEFTCQNAIRVEVILGKKQVDVPHRLLIAIPAPREPDSTSRHGNFVVVPVFSDDGRDWNMALGALMASFDLPRTQQPMQIPPAAAGLIAAGCTPASTGGKMRLVPLLPTLFEKACDDFGGQEQALIHLQLDAQDEFNRFYEFMHISACANVILKNVPLNQENQASWRTGLREGAFQVLQFRSDDETGSRPTHHLPRGRVTRLGQATEWQS